MVKPDVVTTPMADILTTIFPRHSSMSSSTSSDPDWDTAEQDISNSIDDVPSPAVNADIMTTTAPKPTIMFCPVSSDPEWGRVELGMFNSADVPSPTPLIIVTTSSSQHSDDPESCICELDLLDRGMYLVQSFTGEGSFGTVAKALNTFTGDTVAIKILKIKDRYNYDEVAAREVSIVFGRCCF